MRRANLLLLVLGLSLAATAQASNAVRISQVYGGAAGGTYSCDYVELFNNSNAPVDIGGWSLQYGSATGTGFGSATYNWARIPAGATIPACGYYLVRGYCSTAGAALPVTPDLVPTTGWTFNLSAAAGKVALFADQVTGRTCAQAQAVAVDLVGYGTANCYETAAAAAPDASGVLVRASGGAVDTDDNAADFAVLAAAGVAPRNSASAPNPSCGQGAHPPDAPVLVGPLEGSAVVVPVTLAVTVSDPDADSLAVEFYGRALPPPPAPPVATTATNVYATWFRANWDATGGATSYRLDVSTDPGFGGYVAGYEDLTVAGTSRTVAGLAPETPYHYRVRAVNDGGTSGNSNTVTVTTTAAPPQATECELIVLPDTQEYTTQEKGGTIQMFQAQTQWVVDSHVLRNIVAVAHEGDITDKNNATEYERSLTAMTRLEDPVATGLVDGIPYAVLRGNHDSTTELFNQYYGVSRFSGRGYYGGYYGPGNDHNYILFSGAGLDFVMVSLSMAPPAAVLTWAKGVMEAHPDRVGIVVSHSILNESPTIPAPWTSEGSAIYSALRGTPNLRLMLCGHMATTSSSPAWQGEGRRSDTYGGYTIHTLLADYQDRENGGNGKLRIMQFVPAENKVRVRTYSPYTDVWEADADSSSQFTLDVDLSVGLSGALAEPAPEMAVPLATAAARADFALLGTATGVSSGSTASFLWEGLVPETRYEWYVKLSDGRTRPVTGPTWGFTALDVATSVLLGRFTATPVGAGIELRWEFGQPELIGGVTVERAERAEGPWAAVAVEIREEDGVSVALDRGARSGARYWYRLVAVVGPERVTFGPIEATAGGDVLDLALGRPQPNPTSGAMRLDFAVPRASRVSLGLYDMQGRLVATLVEGMLPAGRHQAVWNGTSGGRTVPAGVYFARLRADGADLARRVVVTR
jgi:hypothetical protein